MAQLNFTLDDGILKDLMLGDGEKGYSDALRQLLERVFNAVLNAEAESQIGAGLYERSEERQTYRNGYRTRGLTTRIGSLVLHIPKLRDGTFSTQLFRRYERSEQALLLSMMEMVIQGVSTRKVSAITQELCGVSFSKSTVSALCSELDPLIEAFQHRPLERYYPFLMVDAIYMRAREAGAIRSKAILIAVGVNEEGHREIIGFMVGDGESYDAWRDFFGSLKMRGLSRVDLTTSDDHKGLVKAALEQFVGSTWQRCQTHFSRNMLDRVPKKKRSEVKVLLTDLYNSPDLETAKSRKEALMRDLELIAPKAAETLDLGFDDVTAVFSIPERYRKRQRTTNSVERLNEELRRRERVIRIFPNEDSMTRLMGALLLEHHEQWAVGKKYHDMADYHDWKREREAEKLLEMKHKGTNVRPA
ncbi:MAG: IS256 family transposase [Saccharofermentanales bacterium]|jgi:putative transposase